MIENLDDIPNINVNAAAAMEHDWPDACKVVLSHITSLEGKLAASEAENERLLEEIEGVLSVMPPWSVIRSCEGGGHEDVAGSLALSVSCLVEYLRRRGA